MPKLSSLNLRLVGALICIISTTAAHADRRPNTDAIATRQNIATSAGYDIPAGAFGFVSIARPREVNLLQLRGIAGSGQVVLRTDEPGVCIMFPIRFVAGDIGGERITGHLAEPIHFVLKSRRVAKALARGRDVISDEYTVSTHSHAGADIILHSGLDESFGFVINPGRNILGDIFGVRTDRLPCQNI